MLLVDGCVTYCTVCFQYSLRNVLNTWLRVASATTISWICCIVGTVENTEHPFIFDINKPPDAGRFILDNVIVILI